MKIALITIHNANNYGAILQTFATQEVLKRYGNVTILNYKKKHIARGLDSPIRFEWSWHGLLMTGKDIIRILPRYRALKKIKRFIMLYIKTTSVLSDFDIQKGKADGYAIYIAGSDQIWNPACVAEDYQIDPIYFLNFVPKGCKKISYASSMGDYYFSNKDMEKISNFLSDFNFLSVREKNRGELLSKLLQRRVEHVLDPTLLLKKEDWMNLVKTKKYSNKELGEYFLIYSVSKDALLKKAINFLSKRRKMKIISIDQGIKVGIKVDKQFRDSGIEDFLELFYNAEFIVTDSFHGVCFSLNFNKPFVAVSSRENCRIKSLLEIIEMKNRLVTSEEELNEDLLRFNLDPLIIEELRDKSFNFIDNALRT